MRRVPDESAVCGFSHHPSAANNNWVTCNPVALSEAGKEMAAREASFVYLELLLYACLTFP